MNALSPVVDPPFWRSLTPAELAHYGDVQSDPGTARPGAPWLPAAYRTNIPGCGSSVVLGWVQPPFGLCQVFTAALTLGQITHLPTGNTIGTFGSIPEAGCAADILAPAADWDALTIANAHLVVDPVVDAIEGAGFAHTLVRVGPVVIPVWRRGALH